MKIRGKYVAIFLAGLAGLFGLTRHFAPVSLTQAEVDDLYASPDIVAAGPQAVFHIGHSLVGRDMPAMLAQMAEQGHHYDSQLGWGTTLKAHWEPDTPIAGFETENDHPRYRDAHEAVDSGAYDALVLTEMVEIRDAIKHFRRHQHRRRTVYEPRFRGRRCVGRSVKAVRCVRLKLGHGKRG